MNSNDETKQINNLNNCIMKQITLKSLMLLLLLLIGGGSYAWGEDFVKVTNAPDSWEGSYLFVYEAGNVCFDGSLQKLDVTKNTKGVIIKDGVIAATDELKACCFTVTADSQNKGWYQIKSASNFYIAGTLKTSQPKNGLASTDQEAEASDYLNRFEVDGKGVSVYSQSKDGETVLRFNKAKDQQRFRYYKTGQEPIALYKLSSTATLTSIAVSGTPTKTTYFDGEPFDPTGLVVTGTYDDGTQKEITDGIVWVKDPEILKLGTTSVDVMASVGTIVSGVYTVEGITVKEKVTLIGIEANGTPDDFWKGDKFNHDGITVTARWSDESETNVTELCQFTEPDMTTAGKKTVTVTYENKECTYEIEVKTIENTKETAYTVSEAKKLIDAGKDLATQVYVKGIVSKIDSYNDTYKSITYWLDDNTFQVYSGKGLNGEVFTSKEDIAVGANVIICGKIKKYNNDYEFDKENYLVEYKAPVEKVLKSIAISGEATKTTYFEGETFDPTGLVVTATYDDESTEDVTGRVEWTFNPETLTLGTNEVKATATYGEMTASKTVTVTVTEAPKVVGIDLTKDNTTTANENKLEWLGEIVTVTANKADATTNANNYYPGNGKTSTRFYRNSTLTFTPAPFVVLGEITYEATTPNFANAMVNSTWTNATAKADGMIVTITPTDGSKPVYAKIYKDENTGGNSFSINYSLANETSLTLAAKSDEGSYYATFSSASACEFAGADVFTVNVEGENIVLTEVVSKQVPANTGVLLKSAQNIVTATRLESAPAIEGTNLLKPASEKMTEGFKYYKLAYDNYTEKTGLGFYWGAAEGGAFTVKPGLAYLAVPQAQAANVKGFSFDGTQTGINGVEATTAKGAIYNLNGQRVEKAQRGIYIQNGKKFIVK